MQNNRRILITEPSMSYCKKEGKDKIIFVTEEDHAKKSNITLPEDEEQPGILLPDGTINWNCPCLGGMATGPCGVEFRDAFSCFQYSTATPKGSDCFGQFHTMQECMTQYPNLYPQPDPISDDMINDDEEADDAASLQGSIDIDHGSLEVASKNEIHSTAADESKSRGVDTNVEKTVE